MRAKQAATAIARIGVEERGRRVIVSMENIKAISVRG
jgi:hypothetical protein